MTFLESVQKLGHKAKVAGELTALHGEIELKKNNLKIAKKEFGLAVWDAMVAKDQEKIEAIFLMHKEGIDKLEAEIKAKNDKLEEIHKAEQ